MISRIVAARTLSVIGHPAVLMPVATSFSAIAHRAPPHVLRLAGGVTLAVAVGVLAYSWIQVRTGRWAHVDASIPDERSQLNLFLSLVLLGVAALLWKSGQPASIVAGMAVSGLLVVTAYALRRWLKVSLHVGFGVLATSLVWPHPLGTLALLLLVAGVAWSRWALARHTLGEVLLGGLLGAAAGSAFQLILRGC
jgi:hypothetical protein